MSTTEAGQEARWLPYHETALGAIPTAEPDEWPGLAKILKEAKLPLRYIVRAHTAVINRLAEFPVDDPLVPLLVEVRESLGNQLGAAEREETEKATREAEEAAKPLFPPYLDQGSTGAAVNVLALLLKYGCYGSHDAIVLDGTYGLVIAEAVKDFQEGWGFTDDEVDGNFGPNTRAAFKEANSIDVDELTVGMFTMPTVGKGPESA